MDITVFKSKKLVVVGLVLLILIWLATSPLYASSSNIRLLSTILMYIILAVSWAMFSGPTGYMSLAPAAFFGVGIYTAAFLYARGSPLLPLPAVIVAACAISFVIALLVGLVTLRLKGIYFAIFSFGLIVLLGLIVQYWENQIIGRRGQHVVAESTETVFYVMLAILVATLLVAYFLRRSRWGMAMLSIGGNEEAAAHMGVNTTMVKVFTFAISATFMGAVGAIMATRWIYVDPSTAFNPMYSFMPVLMAVFGGMGQLYGPVLGAAVFAYLERMLRHEFPAYYMIVFGVILIIVVLFLPGGLVGLIPKLRDRLRGVIAKLRKGGQAEQHANT